ncbi:MAG: molybdate ABC transporter substrate-binding protein [Burkholderiales bacterium]
MALALALAASAAHAADPAQVSVAVAANFTAPMRDIAAAFERESGHGVQVSTGSTGKLYAQIKNGAPFQLLLAADADTPERLVREGLAAPDSRFTYAIGRLALWSAQPGVVDPTGDVLRGGGFDRLAIANPRLAPYGAAAVEVLRGMGIELALEPKIVQGENIAQTWQFVSTGNAQLGFVALSQIMKDGKIASGSAWVVPQTLYAPIRQDAVLLASGADLPAARKLMAFLRGEKARSIIESFGYRLAP